MPARTIRAIIKRLLVCSRPLLGCRLSEVLPASAASKLSACTAHFEPFHHRLYRLLVISSFSTQAKPGEAIDPSRFPHSLPRGVCIALCPCPDFNEADRHLESCHFLVNLKPWKLQTPTEADDITSILNPTSYDRYAAAHISDQGLKAKLTVLFFVGYGIVGTLLFCTFLPWT